MKRSAQFFIALVILAGFAVLANAILHAQSADHTRVISFLLVACLAARLKVKLPGLTGSMSVNLPFILVAVAEMSASEALAVACFSTFVQCLPRATQKFNTVQAIFNFSNMALAVAATRFLFGYPALNNMTSSHGLVLALAAGGFFVANTVPVAIVISLTEAKNALKRGDCRSGARSNGEDRLAGSALRAAGEVQSLPLLQALFRWGEGDSSSTGSSGCPRSHGDGRLTAIGFIEVVLPAVPLGEAQPVFFSPRDSFGSPYQR
ncbi:MAG: hypothetical protein DMG64_16355 [Acidobacteria bacterium]|nr:MAG: hypothetical protein DMG64_16355 [Acidobacteriota bacterium]